MQQDTIQVQAPANNEPGSYNDLLQVIDSNSSLVFVSEGQKRNFILEMTKNVEKREGSWVNKSNREININDEIVSKARPFLKIKSLGKYIPKFTYPKETPDNEIKRKQEVRTVLNHFATKAGIVWKSEKDKEEVMGLLEKHFEVDRDQEKHSLLRKREGGIYSKPFTPTEVLEQFVQGRLNEKESARVRKISEVQYREQALYMMGYRSIAELNTPQLKEQYKAYLEEEKYFDQRFLSEKEPLPVFNPHEYESEIKNRVLFEMGFDDEKLLTLNEINQVAIKVKQRMSAINSLDLPKEETKTIDHPASSPFPIGGKANTPSYFSPVQRF